MLMACGDNEDFTQWINSYKITSHPKLKCKDFKKKNTYNNAADQRQILSDVLSVINQELNWEVNGYSSI